MYSYKQLFDDVMCKLIIWDIDPFQFQSKQETNLIYTSA